MERISDGSVLVLPVDVESLRRSTEVLVVDSDDKVRSERQTDYRSLQKDHRFVGRIDGDLRFQYMSADDFNRLQRGFLHIANCQSKTIVFLCLHDRSNQFSIFTGAVGILRG